MQDHLKVLKRALDVFKDRGGTYDTTGSGVEENFTRAAAIASLWLNRTITPRDVALIMATVKMARTAVAPNHLDSYVDLVNYVSFGASFSVPSDVVDAASAVAPGYGKMPVAPAVPDPTIGRQAIPLRPEAGNA